MIPKTEQNKAIDPLISYFTMEIGLEPYIPTYSGGLGVLAGDTVKSAADLELPFIAVTLIYHDGYFRQEINEEGVQINHAQQWNPAKYLEKLPQQVTVNIDGEDVAINAWRRMVKGIS